MLGVNDPEPENKLDRVEDGNGMVPFNCGSSFVALFGPLMLSNISEGNAVPFALEVEPCCDVMSVDVLGMYPLENVLVYPGVAVLVVDVACSFCKLFRIA
jgi:hypothetical protein